jgi:hypothetical protein
VLVVGFYCRPECQGALVETDEPARGILFMHGVASCGVCATCWKTMGRPWPQPTVEERARAHEVEEETRKRMQARKGPDAHMVRAGRT